MEESKKEFPQWMADLAKKYKISLETVSGFYESIGNHNRVGHMNKRQRTESFFELYFQGIKEEK